MYGLAQRLLQIFLVSGATVDQNRTGLDHSVEVWIGPLVADESEGFSNRSGLDLLVGNACRGLCPSPVMKENGHHCVSLKHALRSFGVG